MQRDDETSAFGMAQSVGDVSDDARSFEFIHDLQLKQCLLIKHLPVHDSLNAENSWKYYIDEHIDNRIKRREYKYANNPRHTRVGKFVVKYDFETQIYIVKKLTDPDLKAYTYTTPHSVSLVPKYGKMTTYGGSVLLDSHYPVDAGVLLNFNECQFKSNHVYRGDAATATYHSRYWRENQFYDSAEEAHEVADYRNKCEKDYMVDIYKKKMPITLEELRKETNQDVKYGYNELLVGEKKDAIVGIYAAFHDDERANTVNYVNKLLAIIQKIQLSKRLLIDLPIVIKNENKGLYQYTNIEMNVDLKSLLDNAVLRDEVLASLFSGKHKLSPDQGVKYIENIRGLIQPSNNVNNMQHSKMSVSSHSTFTAKSAQEVGGGAHHQYIYTNQNKPTLIEAKRTLINIAVQLLNHPCSTPYQDALNCIRLEAGKLISGSKETITPEQRIIVRKLSKDLKDIAFKIEMAERKLNESVDKKMP